MDMMKYNDSFNSQTGWTEGLKFWPNFDYRPEIWNRIVLFQLSVTCSKEEYEDRMR